MTTTMRRRATALGLAAGLLATGMMAGAARAQAPERVLRVAPSADLAVLDPMYSAVIITRLYSLMVYETLFSWDSKLQPQPQMVDRWSAAPDQLSWSFTLRPGLKFHDGSPVTTADVAASLKRWMARDVLGQKVATYVASIDAVDDSNFVIRLGKPAPFLPWALGSAVGQIPAIMRAADLAGDPQRPVSTAIGSGPFRFDHAARVSGSRAVFRRNADYQPRAEPPDGLAGGRVVKVDRVEWHVMPDANTAITALQTGEVDLVEAPLLDLLPALRGNRGITVRKINQLNNQGIMRPNALQPPFNDPRARQALALLAGQGDYMSAVVGDPERWHRCGAYYICGGPYGQVAATIAEPDIARARSLLAAAGYAGQPLTVVATKELAPIGQMSEVMIDGLRRAGVNLDVVWTDWGTMVGRQGQKGPASAGGWNLQITYSSGITASNPMTNVGTNMVCNGSNWMGWPCDETTEALRQEFVDAPDQAGRLAVTQRLQARLEEVRPYIPLGEFDAPIAYRSSLRGVLDSPVIAYWNIEKP
ncbi:ABC transporter substrate-binding protein [Roseomonas sp. 18066]|uniref:ABC transporter substrate-binding protein n=1 Tax=Roseomonas sp. 18066 TaxID=2681412 RepID=UPI001F1677DD|nr:ABC transporter substrate-binding protein [Roseomonas sp. 18066]